MLPDFFPLDEQKKESLRNHRIVEKYFRENDESRESEAQVIAESWKIYFGRASRPVILDVL